MSENKRFWIVSATTSDGDYVNTDQSIYHSELEARDALESFQLRCIKDGDSSVPAHVETVRGSVRKLNPDTSEGQPKYIENGYVYYATMNAFTVNPADLPDAERFYDVECKVTRTYFITVNVKAESQYDAEYEATEAIKDGDHDDDMRYFDDQEIEIEFCEAT